MARALGGLGAGLAAAGLPLTGHAAAAEPRRPVTRSCPSPPPAAVDHDRPRPGVRLEGPGPLRLRACDRTHRSGDTTARNLRSRLTDWPGMTGFNLAPAEGP
jgi:hypothetical protein